MITCGSESFYIIENNEKTLTVLSKEKINADTDNPIQTSSAKGVSYSGTSYWYDEGLKVEYGSSFPAYVYNENSNLYKYVEAYENYLKNEVQVTSANAKLISIEQLINLGCTKNYIKCDNSEYKDWIITDYCWWTGSAYNLTHLWNIKANSIGDFYRYRGESHAIRPVVTISKSDIKFN